MKNVFHFAVVFFVFYCTSIETCFAENGSGETLTASGKVIIELELEPEVLTQTGTQVELEENTNSGVIVLNPATSSATGEVILTQTGTELSHNSGTTILTNSGSETLSSPSEEFVVLPEIFLNEAMVNPAEGKEWIEIYNPSDVEINLMGFKIADAVKTRLIFEENVLIPAQGFLAFEFYNIFNNSGDQIFLYDELGNLLDQLSYGEPEDNIKIIQKGESLGRTPDGLEKWVIFQASQATPGAANFAYYDVELPPVFSEINSSSGIITLTWEHLIDADFSHYLISQKSTSSGFLIIERTTKNKLKIENVNKDEVYEFLIQACNQKGNCTQESISQKILITDFLQFEINEFLANAPGKDEGLEWIELFYSGSGSLLLDDYYLEIDENKILDLSGYRIEEYLTLNPYDFGIALKNTNGKISLKKQGINTPLFEINYAAASDKKSWRKNIETLLWEENVRPTKNTENILWNNPPSAFLTIQGSGKTNGEEYLSVNVTAEYSYDADGDDLTCFWDYGDGTFSEKCNPASHKYGVGEFELILKVTDVLGGFSQVFQKITVKPKKSSNGGSSAVAPDFESLNQNYSDNIKIQQFLPNPEGKDSEKEWIEIVNLGKDAVALDWWKIDDSEGESKPYQIPINTWISPGETRLFTILKTGLTLNNNKDEVRVFSPNLKIKDSVSYEGAAENKIYQKQKNGDWEWIQIEAESNVVEVEKTEKEDEIVKTEENEMPIILKNEELSLPKKIFKLSKTKPPEVKILAMLPNPAGKDTVHEYFVVKNFDKKPVNLEGWQVFNQKMQKTVFTETWLQPNEERKFSYQETKVRLHNTEGCLSLFSASGHRTDFVAYTDVQEGEIFTHTGGNINPKPKKIKKKKTPTYDFTKEYQGIVLSKINTKDQTFWFKTDSGQEFRVSFNMQKHPLPVADLLFQKGNKLLIKGAYTEQNIFKLDDFALLQQSALFTKITPRKKSEPDNVLLICSFFLLGTTYWFIRKKLIMNENILRY